MRFCANLESENNYLKFGFENGEKSSKVGMVNSTVCKESRIWEI